MDKRIELLKLEIKYNKLLNDFYLIQRTSLSYDKVNMAMENFLKHYYKLKDFRDQNEPIQTS